MYPAKPMNARPGSTRSAPLTAWLTLLLVSVLAPPLRAQTEVHIPVVIGEPAVESDSAMAARARAGFQSNRGDSAAGENYRAYEQVGLLGRRLLRSLPRKDLAQARAIKPALDSLGFATEVATDPALPAFALLMVRNPGRSSADAVGFLYWYRVDDLRMQGVVFKGGHRPRMRVWRTANPEVPYEWGVLDENRDGVQRFTMMRMNPGGTVWGIQQDEESFPLLGEPGEAAWADLNRDGPPEFVSWTTGPTDSLFTECSNCPKLLIERTFVESGDAFDLLDQRVLPSPYATLVYFVRLLIDGKLAEAGKLLRDPAKVQAAVAQGWNQRVVRKPWVVEMAETGQAWPRRLALRFEGPNGVKRYAMVFAKREGRWIIDNWFEPRVIERRFPSVTMPPDTSAGPRPGTRSPASPAKPPAGKPPVRPAAPAAKTR